MDWTATIEAINLAGELELASGTVNVDYQLQGLPLACFNPNFRKALKASISKGQLKLEGSLDLVQYEPVRLGMNGAITDFSGGLEGTEQSLTSWSVSIPLIAVTDSQIDFMDESLTMQLRSVIGELDGDILGLSTTPGAVAQVDMAGSVDGYAINRG